MLTDVIDATVTGPFSISRRSSAAWPKRISIWGCESTSMRTRSLLEICRARGHHPRVVFTSSVAVYGGQLPETVLETTALRPQTSYGTQKAIGELLLNDYSRRGFVDGRALRLPTISVRPGRPNAAASSFASGIIREPLNGEPSVCPVDRDARLWLMSPATVVDCLIAAHNLPADALGTSRSLNLPGISVTVGEMVDALTRLAGPTVTARIRWERDPHHRAHGGRLARRLRRLPRPRARLPARRQLRRHRGAVHARKEHGRGNKVEGKGRSVVLPSSFYRIPGGATRFLVACSNAYPS